MNIDRATAALSYMRHSHAKRASGSVEPDGSDTRPWFMWGERELTVWQRVRLLLGARLYVRFDAPSGRCSAACDLSHQVTHNKIGSVVWPNDPGSPTGRQTSDVTMKPDQTETPGPGSVQPDGWAIRWLIYFRLLGAAPFVVIGTILAAPGMLIVGIGVLIFITCLDRDGYLKGKLPNDSAHRPGSKPQA